MCKQITQFEDVQTKTTGHLEEDVLLIQKAIAGKLRENLLKFGGEGVGNA